MMRFLIITCLFISVLSCADKGICQTKVEVPTDWVVSAQEEDVDLSFDIRFNYEYKQDAQATDGKCLKMPSGSSVWWEWYPQVPNIPYKLYVSVKTEKAVDAATSVLRVGTADKLAKKDIIKLFPVTGESLSHEQFTEVLIGQIEPYGKRPETYIVSNANSPVFYVDRVYAVPVVEQEQYVMVDEFYQALLDQQQEIKAFMADFKLKDYPIVRKEFVYGPDLAWEELRENAKLFGTSWQYLYQRYLDDMKRHYSNHVFILAMDARKDPLLDAVKIAKKNNFTIASGQISMINRETNTVDKDAVARLFDELEPLFEEYDNFLMWYLEDEPTAKNFYPHMQVKKIIEERQDKRPAIALMNIEKTIKLYGPHMQLLSLDCYPTYKGYSNPWFVGDRTTFARDYAKGPIWMMIPAYSSRGMGMATPAETSIMTYQALLNGAKGVQCFIMSYRPVWIAGTGMIDCLTDIYLNDSAAWQEMKKIGQNLVPVGSLLMQTEYFADHDFEMTAGTVEALSKMRPAVELGVLQDTKRPVQYLVVVNNDIQNAQRAVLNATGKANIYDLYSLKKLKPGEINITLSAAEGRIYACCNESDFKEIKRTILKTRYDMEKQIVALDMKIAMSNRVTIPDVEIFKRSMAAYNKQQYEMAISQLLNFAEKLEQNLSADTAYTAKKQLLDNARVSLSRSNRLLAQAVLDKKPELIDTHKNSLIQHTTRFLQVERMLNDGRADETVCKALAADAENLLNAVKKDNQ